MRRQRSFSGALPPVWSLSGGAARLQRGRRPQGSCWLEEVAAAGTGEGLVPDAVVQEAVFVCLLVPELRPGGWQEAT